VKVALLPQEQAVAPGSTFDLSIEVTRAGAAFNAFDIHIGYDPDALTLLPQTPASDQEGSYFAGGCANRFHRFHPGAGRDTITDVLLCAGASLTGPGQIYRLKFKASNTARITTVRFLPGLQFYNAGLYVNPDSSTDASIAIGVPLEAARTLTVVADSVRAGAVVLRVQGGGAASGRMLIRDTRGRTVRRLPVVLESGEATVRWDGRDDAGHAQRAGRYVAEVRVGVDATRTKFIYER
jgi:hypothetical protein